MTALDKLELLLNEGAVGVVGGEWQWRGPGQDSTWVYMDKNEIHQLLSAFKNVWNEEPRR